MTMQASCETDPTRPGFVDLSHAVEHEAMQPIVGPGVVDVERLEDHQRLAELDTVLDGALQPEIPARPPRRDHPIEHVAGGRVDRALVEYANARGGDRCYRQDGKENG